MPRIFILGDSITQGYNDLEGGWADRLKRAILRVNKQAAIFNLGISGDKMADLLARFEDEVTARTKRWDSFDDTSIIIAAGTNDTYSKGASVDPVTPFESFTSQVDNLLALAQKTASSVYVCSILPFDESRTTPVSWDNISYLNTTAEQFNEVLQRACEDNDVVYIDLYTLAKQKDWNHMIDDGTHPNGAGHAWISEQIQAYIL